MTNRKRWTCPNGAHAGVLAPASMRKIDVRRYCLPCSEEAGILVQRTCPAKERAKAKRKEQRRTSATATRRRDRAKAEARVRTRATRRYERERVLGIHVPSHFQRVCDVPVVAEALRCLERNRPTVKVRRRRSGEYATGHAAPWTGRVVLTLPEKCTWGELATIVAHEVAHICCADEEWHGAAWRTMFLAILEEAYGLKVSWPTKGGKRAGYQEAHSAFKKMLDEGLGNPPPRSL